MLCFHSSPTPKCCIQQVSGKNSFYSRHPDFLQTENGSITHKKYTLKKTRVGKENCFKWPCQAFGHMRYYRPRQRSANCRLVTPSPWFCFHPLEVGHLMDGNSSFIFSSTGILRFSQISFHTQIRLHATGEEKKHLRLVLWLIGEFIYLLILLFLPQHNGYIPDSLSIYILTRQKSIIISFSTKYISFRFHGLRRDYTQTRHFISARGEHLHTFCCYEPLEIN